MDKGFTALLFLFALGLHPSETHASNSYTYTSNGISASGQFDTDGYLDLAIVNKSNNKVSIRTGKGDGTFNEAVAYNTGAAPTSVATGIFRYESEYVDLAVVNKDDKTVSVLLGNGDGTFESQVTYEVGNSPVAITTGDFNDDGYLDLAVVNDGDQTISILLGVGDGTFETQETTYAIGKGHAAGGIAAVDLRSNETLDLVVVNTVDGNVSVLLGNGDGTFSAQDTYAVVASGETTGAIAVGDVDGDTRPDVVVLNSNIETVSVLLGDGDGGLGSYTQFACADADTTGGVTLADFNKDGDLDIAVVNPDEPSISVLKGIGDGTFGSHDDYDTASAPESIAVGDLDNDDDLDLAVVSNDGTVTTLYGDGNGGF